LLFSGESDVTDVWGKLHFGVTPVRLIREVDPLQFTVVGWFPQADGDRVVFGQQLTQTRRGKESFEETNVWKRIP
jgi:hypothetical protein